MRPTRLHLEASDPLTKKVQTIQRFLGEEFFDDSGLLYAMGHY
jgi:hypothetical protein